MKNFKWNIWTVILAVVAVIIGIRLLATVFSWLWILGSFVFKVLVWVALILLVVYAIQWLYHKVTGR